MKRKDWCIEFCGTPFTCESTVERCCMFGKDWNHLRKDKVEKVGSKYIALQLMRALKNPVGTSPIVSHIIIST